MSEKLLVLLLLILVLLLLVTARMRYKREIDREKKKKSTFDLITDNGACLGCLPQISPFTLDVTTNIFIVQRGTPKYI